MGVASSLDLSAAHCFMLIYSVSKFKQVVLRIWGLLGVREVAAVFFPPDHLAGEEGLTKCTVNALHHTQRSTGRQADESQTKRCFD